jgi:D-sedoheptulose 7-phosphate isomerase
MIEEIFKKHVKSFNSGMKSLDQLSLEKALKVLFNATISSKMIFVCGNGASAAISQHMACDFTKGCYNEEKKIGPRVISLNDNQALMTAISNDINYDKVYSYQLDKLSSSGDILVTISSSGNSPNVIEAIDMAQSKGLIVISMTGFDGGQSKNLCDISLHVKVNEYEATEDCHQAIMQILAKGLREKINAI